MSDHLVPPPDAPGPTLSVVTTLYNSARFLPEFHRRVAAAVAALPGECEIVMVNDGSPDESLQVALDLRRQDPRIRIVDLSRNFGHHKALMTGMQHARGELVFLLDCDLEEDPGWLERFLRTLRETGADVVYGVQESRKGGWFERMTGQLFFTLFNRLLTHPIPNNVITARLMTRRYVRALVQHQEREVCIAGLWTITGFEQRPLVLLKATGASTSYTLRRRVSVFVNAVTSFSNRPLLLIFQLGFGVILLSMVAGGVLLYKSLTGEIGVPGWASIMVSIWFLGGVMIFCVGVLGIYLAKIFTEIKQRPYTIVRAEYGGEEDPR